MIRLIHTGDWHLTNNFPYSRMNSITGLNERFMEQIQVVRRICQYAIDNGIKYILVSGDIFNVPNPTSKVRIELARVIKEYIDNDLQFILCSGNHDMTGSWNSMDDYSYMNFSNSNFSFHSESAILKLGFYVELYIVPWGKEITRPERSKNDKTRILLTHQSVMGAKYDNEFISSESLSVKELKSLGYDYIALGHFHIEQALTNEIRYSGSIYPRDFRDKGKDKYFLDITISDNKKVTAKRVVCCRDKFIELSSEDKVDWDNIKNKIIRFQTESLDVREQVKALYDEGGAQWVTVEYLRKEYRNKIKEGISLDLSIDGFIKKWLKDNDIKDKSILKEALEIKNEAEMLEVE